MFMFRLCLFVEVVARVRCLTCPVSVSNLYSRMAGLLDSLLLRGLIDGAIIIQETGFPDKRGKEEKQKSIPSGTTIPRKG